MIDVVIQNQNYKFVWIHTQLKLKLKMKIAKFLNAWESIWTHMHNYCSNSKSKL